MWGIVLFSDMDAEQIRSTPVSAQIAKHLREVHFGGNWTTSSLQQQLAGVTWEQAIRKVQELNTIAALVYHVNYYVDAALKVLRGGPLDAHDQYSFDHPPVHSQEDWERMLNKAWNDAEQLATLLERLPDDKLDKAFTDIKYGSYYRNLHGIIEHMHYHLGQIVLIRKLLSAPADRS